MTKVLVIFAPIMYDSYLRPQQYNPDDVIHQNNYRAQLLRQARNVSDKFRFLHFKDFHQLEKPIWYKADGSRTLIINK